MNVICRIKFPHTPDTSELYMKFHEGASLNFSSEHPEVSLSKNGILSLNTYFNSFYEKFYVKYTLLESLYYLLSLEGDFLISIYREQYGKEGRELIHTDTYENCQSSQPVKVTLPNSWLNEDNGRVYLEITCLSEYASFIEGCLATEQTKMREISLGIITCTFKKEVYVKNTVNTILNDKDLQNKKFKIFVVDNAITIKEDELNDPRVQLIPNRNVGGSGGFTRGLIQALQEDIHTHFLFMDDDIELESESLYRLFTIYEYANQDLAISGSMLDLYKKYALHEAGALYAKNLDKDGNLQYNPFNLLPLNNGLNLNNSDDINHLILENSPDYGGFWFFSFSKETVDEMELPMPFFIRADDVEFGLRITKSLGISIVALPGIAVWHEPFYAKNSTWINYYECRNFLVLHSIRGSLKYLDLVNILTKRLLNKIFIFDYNSAEMIISGFEDYMKGPLLIKSIDPEKLHSKVLECSKKYKTESVQDNSTFKYENDSLLQSESLSKNALKIIIGILTLNGHLLPNFLLENNSALYCVGSGYSDSWHKVFAKKQIIISRDGNCSVYKYDMNRSLGMRILMRWFKIVIKSATSWSSITLEWKNAFKYFTSMEFWKDYLKLN
jgi:galactofuranosylgalactofuranosylrhamnosyl-N-acetylglucosaminyl-diphospho-decaprenol beta-1,5/1,6-galactofuranosyltransferase